MKNIILLIGFFVFIFIQSVFSQTQNYYDTIAWVWVNDEEFFAKEGVAFSIKNELNNALTTNNVIHYEKAFPFAFNNELHKVHEIRLESNGDITSVYNSLTSQFPEKFDRLIRIEEIDTSMHVYDPIDNMWALTLQEPDRWLWHLKKIQADLAWDITKGDPNIRTAVIDTKFDITHPDLVSKISPNYDPFTLEEHVCISSESDWDKHGTTVASLVAAQTTEQGNTIEGQLASVGFNTMMVAYHTDVTQVFLQKALHASIIEGVDVIVSCAGGSLRCSPFDAEIERLVVNEILNNGTECGAAKLF
jgi:subtilisin family serine protease